MIFWLMESYHHWNPTTHRHLPRQRNRRDSEAQPDGRRSAQTAHDRGAGRPRLWVDLRARCCAAARVIGVLQAVLSLVPVSLAPLIIWSSISQAEANVLPVNNLLSLQRNSGSKTGLTPPSSAPRLRHEVLQRRGLVGRPERHVLRLRQPPRLAQRQDLCGWRVEDGWRGGELWC